MDLSKILSYWCTKIYSVLYYMFTYSSWIWKNWLLYSRLLLWYSIWRFILCYIS